jgi:hypothetical protein
VLEKKIEELEDEGRSRRRNNQNLDEGGEKEESGY